MSSKSVMNEKNKESETNSKGKNYDDGDGYETDTMEEDPFPDGSHDDSNVVELDDAPKGRKKPSIVWKHFDKLAKGYPKSRPHAKCRHCGMIYACHSHRNGTRSMKSHLEDICVHNPLGVDRKNKRDYGQQKLVFKKKDVDGAGGGGKSLNLMTFSIENTKRLIARMIVMHELPFMFVEYQGFIDLMEATVCVFEPNFVVPSRFTIRNDIMKLYEFKRQKLKDMIVKLGYRVSLTTDTWTSLQNMNYMVLTAHFIDDDWKIHKRILNFIQVENHRGETIGKEVEKCLKEWGIEKILTLTVDNASSNDTVVAYLVKRFKSGLVLNGEILHVRCCAHILNLIVRDGLKDIDESVNRVRNAVRYVRSSSARLALFKKCIEEENLSSKSLLSLDVQTRWNSTYLMLEAAVKFEKAFDRMEDHDRVYVIEEKNRPCSYDWETAKTFIKFLAVFFGVTTRISGSLYITSNSIFHEICAVQNCIKQYSSINGDEVLRNIATKMQIKFDKYWGNNEKTNLLLYVAVLVDPRYKMKLLSYCFKKLFDHDVALRLCQEVENVLRRMFDEYSSSLSNKLSTSTSISKKGPPQNDEWVMGDSFHFIGDFKEEMKDDTLGQESEVDLYLLEALTPIDDSFDILTWWKLNASRFSVLSKIVRDILAILVTTVSSESTFSTGGRVIDPFCTSLAPHTVETLICLQNWLKSDANNVDLRKYLKEVAETEEAFKALKLGGNSKNESGSGSTHGKENVVDCDSETAL